MLLFENELALEDKELIELALEDTSLEGSELGIELETMELEAIELEGMELETTELEVLLAELEDVPVLPPQPASNNMVSAMNILKFTPLVK